MDIHNEILARIANAADTGGAPEGLLFHGTCERIEGRLRPGGDGILWTSDTSVIAQQYIPAAGIEVMCSQPLPYEMDSRVRPDLNSALYGLACEISGTTVDDVERDAFGFVTSWRIPDGWPTYAAVIEHIEGILGYSAGSNGCYWLKATVEGGIERIMPANWKMDGRLFVAMADGLHFKDIRVGEESDLTLYEHNNLDGFRQAEDEGYDGVVINDFAQTTHFGNFGHKSYGLNARALDSMAWISLPAARFDLDCIHPFPAVTPELTEWLARQVSGHAP